MSAETFTIATGGMLKTANNEVQITGSGIIVGPNSQINASSLTTGTFTVGKTLTVNGTISIATNGWIESADFPTGGGYRLTNNAFILRNGQVSASTFTAGTIGNQGSAGIILASGSYLDIQNGFIRGNGYNGTANGSGQLNLNGSAGWYIGSNGLHIVSGVVNVSALATGTITSKTITIGTSGFITNTAGNFTLSSAGITAVGGTIGGITIDSGSLTSNNFDIGGANGWKINAEGSASFNSVTVKGTVDASAFAGANVITGSIRVGGSATTGSRMMIEQDGSAGIIRGFTGASVETAPAVFNPLITTDAGTRGALYMRSPSLNNYNTAALWLRSASSGNVGQPEALFNCDSVLRAGKSFRIEGSDGVNVIILDGAGVQRISGDLAMQTSNGRLNLGGGSNISGKWTNNIGNAAMTIGSGWMAATNGAMNTATPVSTNVVDFYAGKTQLFGNLRVEGAINASGNINANTTNNPSDIRLKNNIVSLFETSETIEKINMYSFVFKNDKENRTRYGVIAQELEEIIPDAVYHDEEGMKSVAYNDIYSLNVKATQELIKANRDLKARVERLEELLS
jgi:hypothetical protein